MKNTIPKTVHINRDEASMIFDIELKGKGTIEVEVDALPDSLKTLYLTLDYIKNVNNNITYVTKEMLIDKSIEDVEKEIGSKIEIVSTERFLEEQKKRTQYVNQFI